MPLTISTNSYFTFSTWSLQHTTTSLLSVQVGLIAIPVWHWRLPFEFTDFGWMRLRISTKITSHTACHCIIALSLGWDNAAASSLWVWVETIRPEAFPLGTEKKELRVRLTSGSLIPVVNVLAIFFCQFLWQSRRNYTGLRQQCSQHVTPGMTTLLVFHSALFWYLRYFSLVCYVNAYTIEAIFRWYWCA
jgi:hypothetical protein